MKIAICGSLDFTIEIKTLADKLSAMGHDVDMPPSSRKILNGEFTVDDIKSEKAAGTFAERAIRSDAIREYWEIIQKADAILVANYTKKNIPNYVGGNTFLEMGFAHVLRKPIYLLYNIPVMGYTDEISAIQPKILGGDVNKID